MVRYRPALHVAVLTVVAVVGLAIDAYVHFDLAERYTPIRSSTLSQADLFRIEGGLAIFAALTLLIWPRRLTAILAAAVGASALAALLAYRYINVDAIGPVPNMYEPVWFAEKSWSAVAEAVTTVCAAALAVMPRSRRQGPPLRRRNHRDQEVGFAAGTPAQGGLTP